MTQHEALLWQARSDHVVFELLERQDRDAVPECHPLHYLQMASEKLAKAVLLGLGVPIQQFSHVAFSHIPYQLARSDIARKLGFRDFKAYRQFLVRAAPLFRAVDELNPSVGLQTRGGGAKDGPNVEYPWEARDAGGNATWVVPAGHRFDLFNKLRRPGDAARMLVFVKVLLDRFDTVIQ